MSIWQSDLSKRRKTGGKGRSYRKKRAFEAGRPPTETKVGEVVAKVVRTRGGGSKTRLLTTGFANVHNPETKETKKVEILKVLKNPSNIDYDKRGVATRRALIETPLGKAKVMSRPGQDGVVNAILVERRIEAKK